LKQKRLFSWKYLMPYRDDDRQELDPREFPDRDDVDDGLMPCPHCLAVICDASERCPACGGYLSEEESWRRRPWWIWLGFAIALPLAIYWILP
jgi:hypothetical protein